MITEPFAVAAVNAEYVPFDLAAGLKRARSVVARAAEAGALLVAFPELWLPGFVNGNSHFLPEHFQDYIDNSLEVGSPEWEELRDIARESHVYLGMPFSERREGRLYMSQVVLDPQGKVVNFRSKIKPSGHERAIFSDVSGEGNLEVVDTELGRIGQLSCGEHFQPRMTYPMMAQFENLHLCSYPVNEVNDASWWWLDYDFHLTTAKYYAATSGTWVLMPAVGRSAIIDDHGSVVAFADNTDSDFALALIDPRTFTDPDRHISSEYHTRAALQLIEAAMPADSDGSNYYQRIDEVAHNPI